MASATATHVVAVVGGTHGNELAGVHLVRKMQRHPQVTPGNPILQLYFSVPVDVRLPCDTRPRLLRTLILVLAMRWGVTFNQDRQAFVRPGIWVLPVLANPTAVERGVRFVDCDLNRCMAPEILSPPDKSQCIPVKHEEARQFARVAPTPHRCCRPGRRRQVPPLPFHLSPVRPSLASPPPPPLATHATCRRARARGGAGWRGDRVRPA